MTRDLKEPKLSSRWQFFGWNSFTATCHLPPGCNSLPVAQAQVVVVHTEGNILLEVFKAL